jgi:hypothetical protein
MISIVWPSKSAIAQNEEHYFNGTNAESGLTWLWPSNPEGKYKFANIKITVTGIVGKSDGSKGKTESVIVWDESLANVETVSYTLNFDSTRFKNGSTLTVESEVIDNYGRKYSRKITGPVKNKAIAIFHRENTIFALPDTLNIFDKLENAGLYTRYLTVLNANEGIILSLLPQYNVIHVGSHGNSTGFDSPEANPKDPNTLGYISITKITNAIKTKKVSDPPYNFVFFTSCNAMGNGGSPTSGLANAFDINDGMTDRAAIGFPYLMAIFGIWSLSAYSALDEGVPLQNAIQYADAAATKPLALPGHDFFNIDTYLNTFEVSPKIYGDRKMTLHGLYKFPRGKVDWAHTETTKQ